MSMPAPRLTRVAVVAVALASLGLTGCTNHETTAPYQPAAGVQTNAPGVKVRNLMVISEGGAMKLAGSLVASEADTLTKIAGVALKQNGDQGQPLTLSQKGSITLPNGSSVNLADSDITVKGDVKPGGMTKIDLTFGKAQQVSLSVPVVDAHSAGIATSSPTPEASASPSASASHEG